MAKLINNIPLTEPRELELFQQSTGRTQLPNRHERRVLRRFLLLVGRRGGKDRFSALSEWSGVASVPTGANTSLPVSRLLLGRDRKQAAILRRYCRGLLREQTLARRGAAGNQRRDRIQERGHVGENRPMMRASVRGRSASSVIGSEAGHWRHDEASASSDEEVVGAPNHRWPCVPMAESYLLGSSIHRPSEAIVTGSTKSCTATTKPTAHLLARALEGDEPAPAAVRR